MPTEILMPALSPTMTEGNIAAWLKSEGDSVAAGDVILEIETDKATMEVEAVDEGILGKIVMPAGSQGVQVNQLIAWLLDEGEDAGAIAAAAAIPVAATVLDKQDTSPPPATAAKPKPANEPTGERIFASPLAKRIAKMRGLELSAIAGTGPRGRIVKRDVEKAEPAALPAQPAIPALVPAGGAPVEPHREVPLAQMRTVIAERLSLSKQTVPHFYLGLDCELDALLALRRQLNAREAADYKLSLNDFVIKAAASAMRSKPEVNAIFGGDRLYMLDDIDIAVAVAIDGGLITPIVRQADRKSVVEISTEMKDLAARAKAGRLAPPEFQGGGFSISNLGMYGIKDFQAVINPPQAAILAVGAGEARPVVKDGELAAATVMTVNLSVDHRVVDGALAAEWLQAFKRAIEDPLGLLL